MKKTEKTKLETSLEKLVLVTSNVVKQEISLSSLTPEVEPLFHWELDDFAYTKDGIKNTHAHGKETLHKSWFKVTIKLKEKIVLLPEFIEVEKNIKSSCPKSTDPKYDIGGFLGAILPIFLENPTKGTRSKQIKNVIKRFVRDLNREPLKGVCAFDVHGVTLESDRIKLSDGIYLRQSRKEDFEIPSRLLGGDNKHDIGRPRHTMVMEIELEFVNGTDVNNGTFQIIADRYIALFRLYKVGAIQYNSYSMRADMILPPFFFGMIGQGAKVSYGIIPYLISKTNEANFQRFCKTFILPKEIYDGFSEKKVTHLTIAYDRYSEALIETVSPERTITNAVMGLEALFSTDSIELSFKLSTRISKILSFLGYDPLETKRALTLAYSVRSKFSHGGHLEPKLKRSIEGKYGTVDNFKLTLIDYLRVSFIVMTNSNLNKKELIDLIDDSLVENIKAKELKTSLIKARLLLKS